MWLSIGRSFERALGNSVALWAGLLMFITADYNTHQISTALIFSSLELMVFIRSMVFFFGLGIGFFF